MHEARGQDDPRSEGLHHEKEAPLRGKRRHRPGDERQADADHAGDEDGGDGDDLQLQGLGPVVALPHVTRIALRRALRHHRRREAR